MDGTSEDNGRIMWKMMMKTKMRTMGKRAKLTVHCVCCIAVAGRRQEKRKHDTFSLWTADCCDVIRPALRPTLNTDFHESPDKFSQLKKGGRQRLWHEFRSHQAAIVNQPERTKRKQKGLEKRKKFENLEEKEKITIFSQLIDLKWIKNRFVIKNGQIN